MTRPFDGFWDLKNEKRGSVGAAMVILFFVILARIIVRQYTGFVFNQNDLTELNLINEVAGVILPFVLWCVANWALTTLFDGEGNFKEIVMFSAYALVPYVIINIPLAFISQGLIDSEGAFITFFSNLGVAWSGFLLFVGTLTIHQYTPGKTFGIILFIIIGMGIILFIGMLFFILIQQMINFVISFIKEIALRLA